MTIRKTYTQARAHLAELCSEVSENKEVVYITRRNRENVALIAESELTSLLETAHLLRSPKNARRLLSALSRALDGREAAQTIGQLKEELGLEKK